MRRAGVVSCRHHDSSRLGAQIKLAVGVLMAIGCVLLLTHAVPLETSAYAIMFVAIVSVISDFVTAK